MQSGQQTFTVSVIVPACNEENYLTGCLACLRNQSTQYTYEIIVVDNASSDCTADIALAFGAKVIFEPIRGIAHALQSGFDRARGDIIAVTEADTHVPANWLETLCTPLVSRPDIVAVSGPFNFYDSTGLNVLPKILFDWGLCLTERMARVMGFGYFPIMGMNYAVRTTSVRLIDRLDTTLQTCVDTYLSLKLQRFGRIEFLPDLLVSTSARRFKKRLISTLLLYGCNYIGMAILNRVLINRYPCIR